MIPHITVASEDILSEALINRLLLELGHTTEAIQFIGRRGNGYLRSRMRNWCELAKHQPLIILTDLDATICPPSLINQWFGSLNRPNKLLFRVAVREVESWLLADHSGMMNLMGAKVKLHPQPDTLADPKQSLIRAAVSAKREIRLDLVRQNGAMASQGIGYNSRLQEFVLNGWNPDEAATRSPSLQRCRQRLKEFLERL